MMKIFAIILKACVSIALELFLMSYNCCNFLLELCSFFITRFWFHYSKQFKIFSVIPQSHEKKFNNQFPKIIMKCITKETKLIIGAKNLIRQIILTRILKIQKVQLNIDSNCRNLVSFSKHIFLEVPEGRYSSGSDMFLDK